MKKNTLSTKHLSEEDIYLFIYYFFFFGGGGIPNALRETRHETVKTVNKLGRKK